MSSVVFLIYWKSVREAHSSYATMQDYKRWVKKYHGTALSREKNSELASYADARYSERLTKINATLRELRDGRSE